MFSLHYSSISDFRRKQWIPGAIQMEVFPPGVFYLEIAKFEVEGRVYWTGSLLKSFCVAKPFRSASSQGSVFASRLCSILAGPSPLSAPLVSLDYPPLRPLDCTLVARHVGSHHPGPLGEGRDCGCAPLLGVHHSPLGHPLSPHLPRFHLPTVRTHPTRWSKPVPSGLETLGRSLRSKRHIFFESPSLGLHPPVADLRP